jgi:2-polyprenyl-6-methoxyphenol hydroxylase-like FAD-dependent oxidoreductase
VARPPDRTDVAIVGAGPTGLLTALALSQRGIHTTVVERLPVRDPVAKAAALHSRTLEVLEPLGLTEELVARGRVVDRFVVRSGDRCLALIPFGRLPTRYPYTLNIPQNVTEEVIEDALHAAGCPVHRGCVVRDVTQDADAVTLTLDGGQTIHADFVAGTDGLHSTVRERTGIGFPGGLYTVSFVLADVVVDGDLPDDEMTLFLAHDGVLVVAPMPDGRQRIVAPVHGQVGTPTAADIEALLARRGPRSGRLVVSDLSWASRFAIGHGLADRYRHGRVLLAGDAAHVNSPAGGQGMNIGMHDGLALADALADALDGSGDEPLDRYEAQRRPVAVQVRQFTDRMTRMLTSRGLLGRRTRDLTMRLAGAVPPIRHRLAMSISELNRPVPRYGKG